MIYLDNAATTKPDKEVLKLAEKYLDEQYYNPSALYAEGYNLHCQLKLAKINILNTIADENNYEIIFTSCGTEADNQAIFCGAKRGNVVTTLGEHSAIFAAVNELKQRGTEVRFAKLNADGSVNTAHLLSLIDEKTSLVSVIHVNNETGAINDINALAESIKTKNKNVIFHSDGVQAYGKIPFRLNKYIDLYSLSAHKINGLKGCGALIKRKSLFIKPLLYGGGQENGMRSGTENFFGIKTLEFSAEKKYSNITQNFSYVQGLKKCLWELLDKDLFFKISGENSSPYILAVSAVGVRGETVLHEVNDKGLLIGTGSACSSNDKKRYSRVILSCGICENVADGVLRLSFSPENTLDEVKTAAEILNLTVKRRKELMD